MVAICTGPAFATDDAGNLILAGERRLANPSPCALKDANGLYTDPNGGAWTVDQIHLCTAQAHPATSGKQVAGGASVPWDTATFPITNSICWAVMLNVQITWGSFLWINANTLMYYEVGAGLDSSAFNYTPVQSQAYYPGGTNPPTYIDWLVHTTQLMFQFRIEPHTTHNVYAGARATARLGAGGTLQNMNYLCHTWGYAVI